MTIREKGMALVALLGLNVGVWIVVGLAGFSPLLVGVALVFLFLSVGAVGQILRL